MFENLMTAAILTGSALINSAHPCSYLHDFEDVKRHARIGYCHPLCQLTPNEVATLAHMTFVCRAKATHVSTDQQALWYLEQQSNNALASAKTYFGIMEFCRSKGCNRQW